MDYLIDMFVSMWTVLGQMAPYLLFGFAAAGLLSLVVSPEWVERHLGGRGFGPVVKSVLFGIPLPLCSCGVIPVTASIRKHGASRGATLGFLLSTPQTGVDSILATYALLGPVYAVFRPLAALVTGLAGGILASILTSDGYKTPAESSSCADECCTGNTSGNKLLRALRYGFVTLPGDIAKSLLVGIAIAAVISTFIQQDYLAAYLGGGWGAMLVMMAVGIPMYVCATASIPIAVGFMHMGASPGAVLVFLIAGPATNAAAITVVWKLLGRRIAAIYLLTIALGSLAAGLSLDWLYAHFNIAPSSLSHHVHEQGTGWVGHASAVVLLVVLIASLIPRRPSRIAPGSEARGEEATVDTLALQVGGMTCSHCVNAVTRALREAPGVREANVDLATGRAVIRGEKLDVDRLVRAVRALGYGGSAAPP